MKSSVKRSLIISGVTSLLVMAFAGSVGGSLAWWAYSTRSAVSYQGTSVTTSVRLQIGIKTTDFDTEEQRTALNNVGLTEDTDLTYTEGGHTYRYFFTNAGTGLKNETIATYLIQENKHAVDMLYPVTSGEYDTGDDIVLYDSVLAGNLFDEDKLAPDYKYVHIPFVFRIANYNGTSYYADQSIWLTDVMAEKDTSSEIDNQWIEDALRVYFDNGSDKLIVKPSDDYDGADQRKTATYGILDLNNDGYYDAVGASEIVYGQRTITSPNIYDVEHGEEIPDTLVNINGVEGEQGSVESTFVAKHPQDINCYKDYTGITGTYAEYKTLAQIAPAKTPSGVYSGGTPLVTTADHYVTIDEELVNMPMGELDMYIWLEGWDHAVVDSQIGGIFNLGLQFEINLIG